MSKIREDNARDPEQLRRMRRVASSGKCYFCEDYTKHGSLPPIFKGKYWDVKENDFPYKGSIHHYLILSKKHLTEIEQVKNNSALELFKTIRWLKKKLKVSGESVFVRSGDMSITGATLDHLHFHFLVGEKKKPKMENKDRLTVTLGYKK